MRTQSEGNRGMPEDKKPRYKIIAISQLLEVLDLFAEDGYRVHSTQPDYILMELDEPNSPNGSPYAQWSNRFREEVEVRNG